MMAGPNCHCLICQLEKSLVVELGNERENEEYRLLTASSAVLSRFPNVLELIEQLHAPRASDHNASGDLMLLELLRLSRQPGVGPLWRQILLLVFIPTIHRTTSQVAATFPSLTRDDVSQHALATLIEFLSSRELRTRHSHIAFTIARKLRRLTFRWAIRESQGTIQDESEGATPTHTRDAPTTEPLHSAVLLHRFLDSSERAGWLSSKERGLLIQLKVEGRSYEELARQNGHSAVAVRHRMQRLLARLRRFANKPPEPAPKQLELFPR